MGIRYYAYPLDAKLVELARTSPRLFLSDDPLMDAWGPLEQRPPMLYLDKCWYDLQVLLGGHSTAHRPAYDLVAGDVTHIPEGWIPHTAVLDAGQIEEISRDLATVTAEQVRETLTASGGRGIGGDLESEIGYVTSYLRDAQAFSAKLAAEGQGLVYMIG